MVSRPKSRGVDEVWWLKVCVQVHVAGSAVSTHSIILNDLCAHTSPRKITVAVGASTRWPGSMMPPMSRCA